MSETKHVPDIMEVISDLTSNEVRTPPHVANKILDLLPEEVWSNPNYRWFDPGAKSGVFLREATKRLMIGLRGHFPDENVRIEHILTNQMFGSSITELSGLMSRRALYCSRNANSPDSVVKFPDSDGNISSVHTTHVFKKGRCPECGATFKEFGNVLGDNHAYAFIHENGRSALEKEFSMKFDIIVGNPPYQLKDGGAQASASPIYQKFIEQAVKLSPKYIAMVVPSRWFIAGKGLGTFREQMLADRRISKIVDYLNARELFPTINLNGGVHYFLWDASYQGDCEIETHLPWGEISRSKREIKHPDGVFVRVNEAIPVISKIDYSNGNFSKYVSSLKPFGLRTFFKGESGEPKKGDLKLFQNGGVSRITNSTTLTNRHLIDVWKVLIPAATDGNEVYPLPVLTDPIVVGPGVVCTETYLVIGPFKNEKEAESVRTYMRTRLFRFLLSIRKFSQHNSTEKFSFIPEIPFDREWTDQAISDFFQLSEQDNEFIAKYVKEMD